MMSWPFAAFVESLGAERVDLLADALALGRNGAALGASFARSTNRVTCSFTSRMRISASWISPMRALIARAIESRAATSAAATVSRGSSAHLELAA